LRFTSTRAVSVFHCTSASRRSSPRLWQPALDVGHERGERLHVLELVVRDLHVERFFHVREQLHGLEAVYAELVEEVVRDVELAHLALEALGGEDEELLGDLLGVGHGIHGR
jgi:hypothetical protein